MTGIDKKLLKDLTTIEQAAKVRAFKKESNFGDKEALAPDECDGISVEICQYIKGNDDTVHTGLLITPDNKDMAQSIIETKSINFLHTLPNIPLCEVERVWPVPLIMSLNGKRVKFKL